MSSKAGATTPTLVDNNDIYTWTSAAMTADVQDWIDNPDEDFGWILIGDESRQSAKRFASSENGVAANRPTLAVSYLAAPVRTNREHWVAAFYFPGEFIDDLADVDGDSLAALFEYGFGFDPKAANDSEDGFSVSIGDGGGDGGQLSPGPPGDRLDLSPCLQQRPDQLGYTR